MTAYFGLILALATFGETNSTDQTTQSALQKTSTQERARNIDSESAIRPVSLADAVRKPAATNSNSAPNTGSSDKESGSSNSLTVAQESTLKTESSDAEDKPTTDDKPIELKPLKRRVLVFKAEWCGACQQLNYVWPKLEKVRWRIGTKDTDHFQLIDADHQPNLLQEYRVSSLPTVIVLDGETELDRRGVLNAVDLAELYYDRLR